MADKAIGDLTAASSVGLADLFVLEQNNTAKKLTGQTLVNDLATALSGHGGISSIAKTGTATLVDTYTITYADTTTSTFTVTNGKGISSYTQYWAASSSNSTAPSTWYTTLQTMTVNDRYLWSYIHIVFNDTTTLDTTKQVIGVYGDTGDSWYVHIKYASAYPSQDSDMGDTPDKYIGVYSGTSDTAPTSYSDYDWYGWKGPQGDTGTSITGIAYTSSSGLVDTYTVSFDNGQTSTFTVTNGSSIQSIAKSSTNGLTDTYTVTLTNGNTSTFTVKNGKSIVSVTWTGTTSPSNVPRVSGATDTYTILYNDNDTSTFSVYNGLDGTGASISVDDIPSNNGNVGLLTIGTTAPTASTQGSVKSRYFDAVTGILYICTAYDSGTGTYTWQGTGVTVDASMNTSSTNPVQNKVISTKVGTVALNTTASDCSGAINEHDAEIGDVSTLTTTATDLAGAVNELDGDIGTLNTALGDKVSDTGDTMTGNLYIQGASVRLQATNLTSNTAVNSDTGANSGTVYRDSTDTSIAFITPMFYADGKQGLRIISQRKISNSTIQNELLLAVKSNGDKFVAVTDQAAWRRAIGLNYAVNDTVTLSSLAINGYVPTNADRLYLGLPVPKSMEDISTVTVTGMKGALRGISGAIDGTTSSTELTTSYTVTATKSTDNMVRIYVLKSSTMSNNVVNTPVSFAGSVTLKFT